MRKEEQHPIGPQYDRDDAFMKRMRLHQSWYRAEKLRLAYGTGPTTNNKMQLGSMLRKEDAEEGKNFLPGVFGVFEARSKSGGGVESFRCLHNMLSSQPMCFNLFAPLANDLELADQCFRTLFPGEVGKVLDLKIEHAPMPAAEFLDDGTSFDAFVRYKRCSGESGFIGVETKLADPFSRKRYPPQKYRSLAARSPHIWNADAFEQLSDTRWYQLWRNHLLVEALRMHPRHDYAAGIVMVVHHPLDRRGIDAIAGYRSLLRDGGSTLASASLDQVLEACAPAVRTADQRSWLEAFRTRYVDLSGSQGAK